MGKPEPPSSAARGLGATRRGLSLATVELTGSAAEKPEAAEAEVLSLPGPSPKEAPGVQQPGFPCFGPGGCAFVTLSSSY